MSRHYCVLLSTKIQIIEMQLVLLCGGIWVWNVVYVKLIVHWVKKIFHFKTKQVSTPVSLPTYYSVVYIVTR